MRRRGRGTVWMTPRVLSQTASTAASALAMRVRWPHVWAATQSRDVTSMWAVEARSRPYGAGRAVEAASDRTLRRGYRGAPIALRGSDGHAKPPSNAQRFSLVGRLGLSAVPRRPPAHTSPVRRQSRGPSRPLRLGARWRANALATAPCVSALPACSPRSTWMISVIAITTWQPTAARSRPCRSPVERSETSFDWGRGGVRALWLLPHVCLHCQRARHTPSGRSACSRGERAPRR